MNDVTSVLKREKNSPKFYILKIGWKNIKRNTPNYKNVFYSLFPEYSLKSNNRVGNLDHLEFFDLPDSQRQLFIKLFIYSF
jgi:hypothetical protein